MVTLESKNKTQKENIERLNSRISTQSEEIKNLLENIEEKTLEESKSRTNVKSILHELGEAKELINNLESNLAEKQDINTGYSNTAGINAQQYDIELRRVKEKMGKELKKANDDLNIWKEACAHKDKQIFNYEKGKKRSEDSIRDLRALTTGSNLSAGMMKTEEDDVVLGNGKGENPLQTFSTSSYYMQSSQDISKLRRQIRDIMQLFGIEDENELKTKMREVRENIEGYEILKKELTKMSEALGSLEQEKRLIEEQLLEARGTAKEQLKLKGDNQYLEQISHQNEYIEELQNKVRSLELLKDTAERSKGQMQREIDNLREVMNAKEREIQILQKSRDLAEMNEEQLRLEIDEVAIKSKNYEVENRNLLAKLKENKVLIDTKLKQNNLICTHFADAILNMRLPTAINIQGEGINPLPTLPMQKTVDLEVKIENYEKIIKYLVSYNSYILNLIDAADSTNQEMKNKYSLGEAEKIKLEENLQLQKSYTSTLEEEAENLRRKIEDLTQQINGLQRARVDLDFELTNRTERDNTELERLTETIEHDRQLKDRAIEQIKSLHKTELQLKDQKIDKLSSQIKELESKEIPTDMATTYETHMREINLLKEKLRRNEQKCIQRGNDYDILQENYQNLQTSQEEILNKMNTRVDKKKGKIGAQQSKIQDLQERINLLETLNTEGEHRQIEEFGASLRTKEDEVTRIKLDYEELKSKYDSQEKLVKTNQTRFLQTYEDQAGKMDGIKSKNKQLESERRDVENELCRYKAESHRLQELVDEAKIEMKKLMTTSKKVNMRSSLESSLEFTLSDSLHRGKRHEISPTKIEQPKFSPGEDIRSLATQLPIIYEEEIGNLNKKIEALSEQLDKREEKNGWNRLSESEQLGIQNALERDLINRLDNMLEREEVSEECLREIGGDLSSKLVSLKQKIEHKCAQELSELREVLRGRLTGRTHTHSPLSSTEFSQGLSPTPEKHITNISESPSFMTGIARLRDSLLEEDRALEQQLREKTEAESQRVRIQIHKEIANELALELKSIYSTSPLRSEMDVTPNKPPPMSESSQHSQSRLEGYTGIEQEIVYKGDPDSILNEEMMTERTVLTFGGHSQIHPHLLSQRSPIMGPEGKYITIVNHERAQEAIGGSTLASLLEQYKQQLWTAKQQEMLRLQDKYKNELFKQSQLITQLEQSRAKCADCKRLKSDLDITNDKLVKIKEFYEAGKSEYVTECESRLKAIHENELSILRTEKEDEYQSLLHLKEDEIRAKCSSEYLQKLSTKKLEMSKEFEQYKDSLMKEITELREQIENEFKLKQQKLEKEYEEMGKDNEKLKNDLEEKYNMKIDDKEKLFDNILKVRAKEIEEEIQLKYENREYELKYQTQCDTERQKVTLESLKQNMEKETKKQIENLENKYKNEIKLLKAQIVNFEKESSKLKTENSQRVEEIKRKYFKENKDKIESLQRKVKIAEDKNVKVRIEVEDLNKQKVEELERRIDEQKKKTREDLNKILDKNKIEIRNLKNAHKNDQIKKNIEYENELKHKRIDMEREFQNINKVNEVKELEKIQGERDEKEKYYEKKLSLLRSKFESDYEDKERILTMEFEKKQNDLENQFEIQKVDLEKTVKREIDNSYTQNIIKIKNETANQIEEDLRTEYET